MLICSVDKKTSFKFIKMQAPPVAEFAQSIRKSYPSSLEMGEMGEETRPSVEERKIPCRNLSFKVCMVLVTALVVLVNLLFINIQKMFEIGEFWEFVDKTTQMMNATQRRMGCTSRL